MNPALKTLIQLGIAALAASTVGVRSGAVTATNAPAVHGLGNIGSALWDVPNAWAREAIQWFLTKGIRRALYGPLLLLLLWVCHVPGSVIALITIYLCLVGPFGYFRRLIIGIRDPLAVAFITAIPNGWGMVRILITVITGAIGFGLLVGITLSFVPAANLNGILLVPGLILLVLAALFFLVFGAILQFELLSIAGAVSAIGALILLVVICLGGGAQTIEKVKGLGNIGGVAERSAPVLTDATIADITPEQPEWEIPLSANAWSGWIKVPPRTSWHFRNNGKMHILTISGKFYKYGADETRWLGKMSDCTFRLMGDGGTVRVWID